jgi:predicted nucleic acid-binding protein
MNRVNTDYFKANYLDASAAVKLVLREPGSGSDNLRHYFHLRGGFHITTLCFAETLAVFKRKWMDEEIPERQYHFCCYLLVAYCSHPARIHLEETGIENRATFHNALQIAGKYKLDLSDALQLLTVKDGKFRYLVGESKTVLITADGGLEEAAKAEGLRVWNCEKESLPPTQ